MKKEEKNLLIRRFFILPDDHCFLFGPRGTGKSTWLRTMLPGAYFLDLLDDVAYRNYQAYPERLREVVLANLGKKDFVIDEIQRIPNLLNTVHQVIETIPGCRFILTGSSARKLKRSGVNLLAGRAVQCHLHPFMAAELAEQFSMAHALRYGLIPLISLSKNPEQKMEAYLSLYLKEEVHMESLVRNIGSFSRFLEAISFSHASILNLNNIARECQVSRKLAENYLEILEDLLLSFTIPVFTKRSKRVMTTHPKFYLFDAGVFTVLRPKGILDQTSEIHGLALEGLVAHHLRTWCDLSNEKCQVSFWRTKSGAEVDFIVYGGAHFYAIEVKHSPHIHPSELHGLEAFFADYPESTPILLYQGTESRRIGSVLCLPVESFLRNLRPNFWPDDLPDSGSVSS